MSDLPFSATTPVHIGAIGLKARNGEELARFYREEIGLRELSRRNGTFVLGTATRPLLEIETDGDAKVDDPREAGLYHTAFLLPSRAHLARWLRRAAERQTPIQGASDHLVSEAIYLSDPEGNGIEIYADRPKEVWSWDDGEVEMKTLRLDIESLLSEEGGKAWEGAPEGTVIGHVHLRVGDPSEAEKWWRDRIGLNTTAHFGPQAVFLSSGGYHHHIGANSWHSSGAGKRDPNRAGLAWIELQSASLTQQESTQDPWGTVVRLVPQQSSAGA